MKRYCVIGEKLGHTLSPKIHALYFGKTGIDGSYGAVELPRESMENARGFLSGYDGVNVTIPYKQTVIGSLDGLSDEARGIGAVNTVFNDGGKLIGYNTDPFGFTAMLASRGLGNVRGRKAYVLGYGGAARSVLYALKKGGADVTVVSRDPVEAGKDGYRAISYAELGRESGYLLVNATPVGMYPREGESPVGADVIKNFDVLADLVYNPMLTEFLSIGLSLGKRAVGGLYMLVAQAVGSQRIWQGRKHTKRLIDGIYLELSKDVFAENGNIWLVGMPGSGKSTLGAAIAEYTGRRFVDADEYIVKTNDGMTIAEMFRKGEDFFRGKESEAMARLAREKGLVIATGGGCIERETNVDCMRLSGIAVYIDRPVGAIAADVDCASRPLLADGPQRIAALYDRRKDKYLAAGQVRVKNTAGKRAALGRLSRACSFAKNTGRTL